MLSGPDNPTVFGGLKLDQTGGGFPIAINLWLEGILTVADDLIQFTVPWDNFFVVAAQFHSQTAGLTSGKDDIEIENATDSTVIVPSTGLTAAFSDKLSALAEVTPVAVAKGKVISVNGNTISGTGATDINVTIWGYIAEADIRTA